MNLSDQIVRKFEEVYEIDDYEIWTDTGWEDLIDIKKTILYDKWEIALEDGYKTSCADTHIFFDQNLNEIYCKDVKVGSYIQTEHGSKKVLSVTNTNIVENMYDVGVDSDNHRYYGDGILSHNSLVVASYITWFTLFHSDKNSIILSNVHSGSKEVFRQTVKFIEMIPFFLQPGALSFGKESMELSNNSRIETASSSGDSCRGKEINGILYCVAGDTKITVKDSNGEIKDIKISGLEKINNLKRHHIIYKTTNLLDGKTYIGKHSTNNLDDGYLGSGTLLKRSIKTHGTGNFKREILFDFDNETDAYTKEAELVTKEFVLKKDTYNLIEGGLGSTINQRKPRGKDKSIVNTDNGIVYPSLHKAKKELNNNYLVRDCGDPNMSYEFENQDDQLKAIKVYENYLISKNNLSKSCSERFKGVPKSPSQRFKISKSNKGKMCLNLHNKDPEKIRKTAEAHRGMKRSDEAKRKMSLAKKGNSAKNRKLSKSDILKIRGDYDNKVEINLISEHGNTLEYKSAFCKNYSKIYSVSVPCIRGIVNRNSYNDVI